MQITRREVLFSTIIVVVLLTIGLLISNSINTALLDKFQEYDNALKIEDDRELFEYGMRTNVGNAFVYGELKCLDPVTYPEIGGQYSHVEKVKERYTEHTKTVTYTDADGKTRTRTETYWTWDRVDSDDVYAKRISFLGVEFKYGAIRFSGDSYICTQRESSRIRYKYYGAPIKETGTIYTTLSDNTISKSTFYSDMTIEQTIQSVESKWQLGLFWVFWVLLMIAAVIGFYYIDNRWLED